MDIREIEVPNIDGTSSVHVIINHADGSYTSMLKSTYDELQAQTNEIGVVTNGDN